MDNGVDYLCIVLVGLGSPKGRRSSSNPSRGESVRQGSWCGFVHDQPQPRRFAFIGIIYLVMLFVKIYLVVAFFVWVAASYGLHHGIKRAKEQEGGTWTRFDSFFALGVGALYGLLWPIMGWQSYGLLRESFKNKK